MKFRTAINTHGVDMMTVQTKTAAVTSSVDFKPNGPRSEAINLDAPCKQFLSGHPRPGVISYTMAEMDLVID